MLRSPAWPEAPAEEGRQDVTYAPLAHSGLVEGGLLMEGEDVNRPLLALAVCAGAQGSWRRLLMSGPRSDWGRSTRSRTVAACCCARVRTCGAARGGDD
jgi:hypothetical protein